MMVHLAETVQKHAELIVNSFATNTMALALPVTRAMQESCALKVGCSRRLFHRLSVLSHDTFAQVYITKNNA